MEGWLRRWLVAGVPSAALIYDPLAPASHPKRFVAQLFVVIAAAVLLGRHIRSGRVPQLRLSTAGLCWAGFAALSCVSVAWGKPSGIDTAATWVAGAGLIVIAGLLQPEEVARLARASAWWIGTTSSVVVLAQWGMGIRGVGLHGTQGNGNWLGILLAVTLPLAAGFVIDGHRRQTWWWGAACVGVVLHAPALLCAGSRVALISAAVTVVLGLAGFARRKSWAAGAVMFATALLLVGSRAGAEAEANSDAAASLGGRRWIWETSLAAAKEALPWGTGVGGFSHAYLEAQGERLRELPLVEAAHRFHNATTAHQDWLQALVETGPLGLALLAGGLMFAVHGALRQRQGAAALALVAVSVCALGDSPLHQPAVVLLCCLCIAVADRRWQVRAAPAQAALLGVVAVLTALSASSWMSARLASQARDASVEGRMALLQRALRLEERSGEGQLALGLTKLDLGDHSGAIVLLEQSAQRLANVGTEIALGNAWLESDDAKRAERHYRRALAYHPASFRAHANLCEALRRQGELVAARRHLEIAKRLYPGHTKLAELESRLEREGFEPSP